jgi:arylsulfatase
MIARTTTAPLPVLVLFLAAGCSDTGTEAPASDAPAAPLAGRNVVLVVSDTLRADHLGFLGYPRDTSPFLDTLAAEGVVFTRAYSCSSFTRESISALFTGRLPSLSGSAGWWAAPSSELRTVGELYRAAGYRTGLFTATVMLSNERFEDGFDEVDQLARRKDGTRPGKQEMNDALTDRALAFAAERPGERFLMYVHYLDPHGPYTPAPELQRRFTDEILEDRVKLYAEVRPRLDEFLADGFAPGERRFEDMVVRYDAEIASVDQSLERLFDGLADLGLGDDTLFVFTSDHGEEFLDHGFVEHGWTVYDEATNVPLVFWAPPVLAPARIDTPVSLADVLPTLAALTGVRTDRPGDGLALFAPDARPLTDRDPVVVELLVPHRGVMRSTVQGHWKLIQARKWLTPSERSVVSRDENPSRTEPDRFDTFGPIVREELYDLANDPGERTNLIETHPEKAEELRRILAAHEQRARTSAPAAQGALNPDDLDPEALEQIRALGY